MAFTHGVYTQEIPTSLLSPTASNAGLPVVVGTAPVHLGDISNVNKPVLCYTYAEAVKAFGFSKDFEKYTLCEFIYSQFALYGMSPCVLINVLDPNKHSTTISAKSFTITSGKINLGTEILVDGFEAANLVTDDEETSKTIYEKDADYTLEYDSDGALIFEVVSSGALANAATVYLSYKKIAPEAVGSADVIGGVDINTGKYMGLELVSRVFPRYTLIPGLVAAPKFSELPEVAAVMVAKSQKINGLFNAMAVIDIPYTVPSYQKAAEWKNSHGINDKNVIACWPRIKLGEDTYHLSTQLIGLMNSIDAENDDVPYVSPSNHVLKMDSSVIATGAEVDLGLEEANELNRNGIVTALNWVGGWKAWGNRTAIYPSSTDVKDAFIPVRRMFDWLQDSFISMFWQETDAPINRRLIRTIVNSFNVNLNGLAAREMILGGRIEFLDSENPVTDLLNGNIKFHISVTPPIPAETLEGIFEFDVDSLNTLFNAE